MDLERIFFIASYTLFRHPALIVALAVWLSLELWSRWWKRRHNPAQGASKIQQDAKALYSTDHEYVPVNPADFPGADLAYYDLVERELSSLGFRNVGDLEDATLSHTYPNMRTFIRSLVSADATTVAGIFHVRMRGWMKLLSLVGILPAHMRTTCFESELADGSFVCTANNLGLDLSSAVPGIDRQCLPKPTPPTEVWAKHRARLSELAVTCGQPRAILRTAADNIALQHKIQAVKNRAKAAAGYVDLAQFDRCASKHGGNAAVREMREKLAQLQMETPSEAK